MLFGIILDDAQIASRLVTLTVEVAGSLGLIIYSWIFNANLALFLRKGFKNLY